MFIAPVLPSNMKFFSWVAKAEKIKGMTVQTCVFIVGGYKHSKMTKT